MAEAAKLIFMGTPEFAAIILEGIIERSNYKIAGVFTQPDKKSGRKQTIEIQPVKKLALQHDFPVFQPASLRGETQLGIFKDIKPDFIVVAAYGLIIPQNILDTARLAPVNVHGSMLPALRGAAPIQRAVMSGWQEDACTGISIMKIVAKLDAGPVYAEEKVPILQRTSGEMQMVLAHAAVPLLLRTLQEIEHAKLHPVEQDESLATYAPKLEKADGIIDWTNSAAMVDAHIRGVTPWPGARGELLLHGAQEPIFMTLLPGRVVGALDALPPGSLYRHKSSLMVACGDKWYELGRLKEQGRKELDAAQFINGHCKAAKGLCGMFLPVK